MGLTELNNGRNVIFAVDNSKDYRFIKKNDLPLGQSLFVRSVYLSKGKFGFQSVILFDNGKEIKGRFAFSDNGKKYDIIKNDIGLIDTIRKGNLKVIFEKYHSKKFDIDTVGSTFEVVEQPIY